MTTNIMSRVHDALASARADLDQLRDEIAELHREIRIVESLPVDGETMSKRIDDAISKARDIGGGLASTLSDRRGSGAMLWAQFNAVSKNEPFAIAAWLQPEALREYLLSQAPTSGISDAERSAKLADLRDRLQVAEMAEEAAIRQIEAASGSHLPRRTEADPAILLAPDHELG